MSGSHLPKGGGVRGSWPLPERPQGSNPGIFFFKRWIKRLLGRKIDIKVQFMCPWLPEGPLMTQWAPAVIRVPLVAGGTLIAWGPP